MSTEAEHHPKMLMAISCIRRDDESIHRTHMHPIQLAHQVARKHLVEGDAHNVCVTNAIQKFICISSESIYPNSVCVDLSMLTWSTA